MGIKFKLTLTPPFLWYAEINYSEPYHVEPHSHSAWQLTLPLKEDLFFIWQGEKHYIAPGEWILISPELFHSAGCDSSDAWAIQLLFRNFPPNLLPEFSRRFNFLRNFCTAGVMPEAKTIQFRDAFAEIGCEKTAAPESLKNLLPLQLIVEALSGQLADIQEQPELPPEFANVLKFMEENLAAPIGITEFANTVNLSESRFSALFRHFTGLSPMRYFNELRIGHAQELLLSGESVQDAALKSGFVSASYFCRKFKKYTGKTPGEFCADHIDL